MRLTRHFVLPIFCAGTMCLLAQPARATFTTMPEAYEVFLQVDTGNSHTGSGNLQADWTRMGGPAGTGASIRGPWGADVPSWSTSTPVWGKDAGIVHPAVGTGFGSGGGDEFQVTLWHNAPPIEMFRLSPFNMTWPGASASTGGSTVRYYATSSQVSDGDTLLLWQDADTLALFRDSSVLRTAYEPRQVEGAPFAKWGDVSGEFTTIADQLVGPTNNNAWVADVDWNWQDLIANLGYDLENDFFVHEGEILGPVPSRDTVYITLEDLAHGTYILRTYHLSIFDDHGKLDVLLNGEKQFEQLVHYASESGGGPAAQHVDSPEHENFENIWSDVIFTIDDDNPTAEIGFRINRDPGISTPLESTVVITGFELALVPEPSSLVSLLLGLACLAVVGRRAIQSRMIDEN